MQKIVVAVVTNSKLRRMVNTDMRIKLSTQRLCVFLFQCAYIADAVLGSDPVLYSYSKFVMIAFWGSVLLYIATERHFQVKIGAGFLLPTAFTILCAVSCLWARNQEHAFFRMTTQWQLFLLFVFAYILLRQTRDIEPYFKVIYISGYAMLLFTIYRYGFSGFFSQMMGGIRMGGKITNENTFGMIFSQALMMAYYYYLKSNKKIHIVSMAIFVVFALSSGSKKALIMCIAGIVGLSFFYYGFKRIWKTILAVVVVAIVGYWLIQLPLFSVINDRITSYLSGDFNVSDANRKRFIEVGIQLIKERPLFGWGFANFSYVSGIGTYSHNNFVEIWVSSGVFSFLIYYSMYVTAIWTAFRRVLRRKETSAIVLLIIMLISLVFGYGMIQYDTKDTWIFVAVMMYFVDDRQKDERRGVSNAF